MKLSDTFDCTEGGAEVASGPVVAVAVDAAEMDEEEADGAGDEPLFALVKSDINVDDDDLIESSTDAADAETDLYMDSNLDDMLLSLLPLPLLQVRSVDAGFLCLGCFEIVDAIF